MEKSSAASSEAAAGMLATPTVRAPDGPTETITVDPRNRGDR
jgi:hypothetical protein